MVKRHLLCSGMIAVLVMLISSCGGKQPDVELNVMTFNVRLDVASDSLNSWKYRKDNAAQMITYYAPDIVGMQEVLKNQLDDLKECLPEYTQLGVGRADGKEKGEYCPLFFKTARFDLIDYGNFGMSEIPDSIGVKGWDAACERITTWAILKDKESGKQIAAFNTHFDHVGQVARKESAILILDKMKQIAGKLPVVLTGDFNGELDSDPIRLLSEGGMVNTYTNAAVVYGPSWTFHAFGNLALEDRTLIDYVLVKGEVEAEKCRVIGDKPDNGYLSDHAPVMATLKLK